MTPFAWLLGRPGLFLRAGRAGNPCRSRDPDGGRVKLAGLLPGALLPAFLALSVLAGFPSQAAAQTKPTLTITANVAKLKENDRIREIALTGTLSEALDSAIMITPFAGLGSAQFGGQGGLADGGDFVVSPGTQSIRIAAGTLTGTGRITLDPTDDNFWELEEEIKIGIKGTHAKVTIVPAVIRLEDQDTKPSVKLTIPTGKNLFKEGSANLPNLEINANIEGDPLDDPLTVSLNIDAAKVHTDIAYDPAPPWEIVIAKRREVARKVIKVTLPDDTAPEGSDTLWISGTATALGTTFNVGRAFIGVSDDDRFKYTFRVLGDRTVDGGETRKVTFEARIQGKAAVPKGGITLTLKPCISHAFSSPNCNAVGAPKSIKDAFSPASLEFTFNEGMSCAGGCKKTGTWTVTSPKSETSKAVAFRVEAKVSDPKFWFYQGTSPSTLLFLPPVGPAVLKGLELFNKVTTNSPPLTEGDKLVYRVEFNRSVLLAEESTLRVRLDSGPVDLACRRSADKHDTVWCVYSIQKGDYDYDGKLQIAAGGLDLGPYLNDPRAPDSNFKAPIVPSRSRKDTLGVQVYGTRHAFRATATVREGFREGELNENGTKVKVVFSDVAQRPALADLRIPITVGNKTTTYSDWRRRSTGDVVVIKKGKSSGEGQVILDAPLDGLKEGDEILLIGGGGGFVVQPAELTLRDSTTLTLTADVSSVTEGDESNPKVVTLRWEIQPDALPLGEDIWVGSRLRGSATPGVDYTLEATDGTRRQTTLKKGKRFVEKEVPLKVIDDLLVEGEEEIKLVGVSRILTVSETSIKIVDNDKLPKVILSATPPTVSEGGGTQTITVIAELGPAQLSGGVDVTLDVGGTASAGTDYTATWSPANKVIRIPQNSRTGSAPVKLTVVPLDDMTAEGTEAIQIQGTAFTSGGERQELSLQPATVSLSDNDTHGIEAVPTNLTIQAGLKKTYKLRLKSEPVLETNEKVRISPGVPPASLIGAAPDVLDFTAADWNKFQTVTVTVDPDALAEDRDVTHSVGGGDYSAVTAPAVTVEVVSAPKITLKLDKDSVPEGGEAAARTATVTAELDKSTSEKVTLTVSAAPGTGTAAGDFTLAGTTLTIAAGSTASSGTVRITANDNDFYAPDGKKVTISATAAGHAGIENPRNLTLKITDDDVQPEFSVAAASAAEGDPVKFTVTRAGAPDNVVSVKWSTKADDTQHAVTATAGTDYRAVTTAQTLSFAKGVTTQTFTVTTTEDTLDEPAETFKVALSSPGGGAKVASAGSEAVGTITDDDAAPSFSIAAASAAEGEAVKFTVTRGGAPDNVVTVKVNTAADPAEGAEQATAGTDYRAVTTAQTLSF
ncbi:MAG: hypothetical protein OXG03_01360, partial [Gammaproteobacteria bacterium]|nr:hypothetical protein [Gammaproteobacteria bacterium]